MIRIEESDGWTLVAHRDHARLAAAMAERWNNAEFAAPEPRAEVLTAVARHDDAWQMRDAEPCLTREGRPSAFSRELVGTYSAFEEIDLEDYLNVRGRATELAAAEHPYAAVLISMHTVNLLTERADWSGLSPAHRELLGRFVAGQEARQAELSRQVGARAADLRRAFEFLQACDSLSLLACVRYPQPQPLRHAHPKRHDPDAARVVLLCTPLGDDAYRIAPYPFDAAEVHLSVPRRRVHGRTFVDHAAFRAAYAAAPVEPLRIRLVR
jgi:hypothetical protein